ncbi:MAG: hypothetical protein ABJ387_01375 [Balneola sp.]
MSTRNQRIKRCGYDDDGAGLNKTWIQGNIHTNGSSITVDNIKNQTPGGNSYGGSMVGCEIMNEDHAGYAALEALMTSNTEKYFYFEYNDGRVYKTQETVQPFVKLVPGIDAREGNEPWSLDFEAHSGIPLLAVEP